MDTMAERYARKTAVVSNSAWDSGLAKVWSVLGAVKIGKAACHCIRGVPQEHPWQAVPILEDTYVS